MVNYYYTIQRIIYNQIYNYVPTKIKEQIKAWFVFLFLQFFTIFSGNNKKFKAIIKICTTTVNFILKNVALINPLKNTRKT